ncbi:hypothetical protein POJ06DRAFT_40004 [Lipomyces tetrasporus]|uniref:HIG1 domain-containing protein n=1 Tax=Lipomyces tetrasporus TaxID=54092 RepID=A0AAD7QLM6_9ASCO|nr:uncharacterized protein POJ06DRAFT_40004 [Lipomyces tetrasporus]KAJ8097131.1 hypothetical protein POJ06DRAFT_40004 [Lipomyces tetrasporus]
MANEVDAAHLTAEQRTVYEARMKKIGLAKGAAAGAGLGLGFNYLAKMRFPVVYKSVTFRVAAFMIPFIGLSRVGADRELSHAIHRERGVYQRAEEDEARFSKLSAGDKIKDFAFKNRLSLIFGAWLASLGVSGYAVSRDKLMTRSQKIVQARMYAQGLTLLLVIATAIATMTNNNEPEYIPDPNDKHHHLIHNRHTNHHRNEVDDHWKMVLEQEQEGKR